MGLVCSYNLFLAHLFSPNNERSSIKLSQHFYKMPKEYLGVPNE